MLGCTGRVIRRAVTGAALAATLARVAPAAVTRIDPAAAGDDLGEAVNRAIAEAPGMLIPDASLQAVAGSLIAALAANATARAVPKKLTALSPGSYSVVVSGVSAQGEEVAVGEPVPVAVAAGQVLEVTLPAGTTSPPAAGARVTSYSVYAGAPGAETIQAQEVAPGSVIRLIDPTEFFNRRQGDIPYYGGGPGPPVTVRVVVGAYAGARLVALGAVGEVRLGPGQSVRVDLPRRTGLTYTVFAATGAGRERLQVRELAPGSSYVLPPLSSDGEVVPGRAVRVEIGPGEYRQVRMIVIDRPEVTLSCLTPATIRASHGFDQSAVLINPSILGPLADGPDTAIGDNVGGHRLHDVTVENCTWDMAGQIETAATPAPDDFRNFAVSAWATDGLTLRGLRIRDNLRGGVSALSCSDVRIEGNHIERNRGRARTDDSGRLLPGRGVGNAINVARNAPFSDPVGDLRQTRTVIANNIIVGDDYGEMYGIVAAAGGASENTITGNTISHLRGACIALEGQNERDSGRTTISGNTCSDTAGIQSENAGAGPASTEMRGVTITGNTLSSNRAAGISVSSSNTTVVGNVIDGCHLASSAGGCVQITPPRRAARSAGAAETRNLLIADNVIALGRRTRSAPPVGVYVNGAVPLRHVVLAQNRIDCEATDGSTGVQISGDVADLTLQANQISDCGGDGVVVTDFSMTEVEAPQRVTAIGNVFRNLNLSDRWMDGRHPVGAAFRFMIDGIGNESAGHRLRDNRVSDEHDPPRLRYGVILDVERPGALRDVRIEDNEWNARTDDVYDTGAADLLVR